MQHPSRPKAEFMFFTKKKKKKKKKKKNIRAMFNLGYNAHTSEYFIRIFIHKCNELYKLNLCCYLYEMFKNVSNNYFAQSLSSHSELHNQNTRNKSYLMIQPVYLTKFIRFSINQILELLP